MSKKKILIVEDESIIGEDIKNSLNGLNYEVSEVVASGEEALKQVKENKPDLVLMDMKLQGKMEGIEASRLIRSRFNIPVVFLTAHADEKTLERAKKTDPFGYIIKPFDDRELCKTVEMALHKHQLETKLKESEEWLSTTLKSIGDAVITTDNKGLITFMNPVAESLTGWKLEDATEKPLEDVFNIINEKTGVKTENPVTRVIQKGAVISLANHTILISKDGTKTPIDDSAAPIRDNKGNMTGVVLVFRDITERKKTEESLLFIQKINNMLNARVDSDEVFKTIVDGLLSSYNYESVAIHLLSKDQKYLTIESYSAESKIATKFEKLLRLNVKGFKVPLYEGSLLKEVVDTREPVITNDISWVLKSYSNRKSLQKLIPIVAKLTKANWGMGVPLLAEDKVVGIIGCGSIKKLTDADSKRLADFGAQAGLAIEKAQIHNRLEAAYEDLKGSNQLKDLFIDIMRHDLFNPAGVVSGVAEVALLTEKNPERKSELEMILRNTDKIIDMIENASKLAKMESGETLEVDKVDLCVILRSVVKELTSLADEKDIKIKFQSDREILANINPLIYDVFLNLINNAIKYSPEKSEIVIRIKRDRSNWKISVTDQGEGIPDKDKKAIFERFKRIGKGPIKGSGLGLAIVKRAVDAHDGRVWVEDNPEGGSIFYVTLKKS